MESLGKRIKRTRQTKRDWHQMHKKKEKEGKITQPIMTEWNLFCLAPPCCKSAAFWYQAGCGQFSHCDVPFKKTKTKCVLLHAWPGEVMADKQRLFLKALRRTRGNFCISLISSPFLSPVCFLLLHLRSHGLKVSFTLHLKTGDSEHLFFLYRGAQMAHLRLLRD